MDQIQRLNVLKKHAKNFVASPKESRPVYTGIHYAKDGVAVVTDTRYLLRVENAHSYQEPITRHHKTDEVIEGSYPNTDAIWPKAFRADINIDLLFFDSWLNYHSAAEMVTKDNYLKKSWLATKGNSILATCSNPDAEFKGKLPGVFTGEEFKVCYNPVYMKNIINAVRGFKPTVITLKVPGTLDPLVINTDVGVSALLLQIRDI